MIKMEDYGVLLSRGFYLLDHDHVTFMQYTDNTFGTIKETAKYNKELDEVYYDSEISPIRGKKKIKIRPDTECTLQKIKNLRYPGSISYYTKDNSPASSMKGMFDVTVRSGKTDLTFSFDAQKMAVVMDNKVVCSSIYGYMGTDDTDHKKLTDHIQIDSTGTYSYNFDLRYGIFTPRSKNANSDWIMFSDYIYKSTSCAPLDDNPKKITVYLDRKQIHYQCDYDGCGIMDTFIEVSTNTNLCRYEWTESEELDFYDCYSIHPLVFDPFNVCNMHFHLNHWAVDHYCNCKDTGSFERKIYYVQNKHDLEQLKKEISAITEPKHETIYKEMNENRQ